MKIKNIHNNTELSISYQEWKQNYLKNNKFINFEIINHSDILELHSFDEETGDPKFNQILDSKIAQKMATNEPQRFFTKKLEFNDYDENLLIHNNTKENTVSEKMIIKENEVIELFDKVLLFDKNDINFSFMKILQYFVDKKNLITLEEKISQFAELNGYVKPINSNKINYQLTQKGIDAKYLGGHIQYMENKFKKESNIKIENYIGGNNNGIQSSNSNFTNPTIENKQIKNPKNKASILEILSWIVGILIGLVGLYEFIIKKIID
ncbi:hypothetical protein FLJC2902T_32250 [Flavobacterium limnosediminis JC2902]|uniref:Transmembrane protein n=1 Tax=Flavobacterium limnosediminis JC2902 TaxID=1341181 RepID=V6SAI6_9FLAO|nr:hypothetical protein [Flavobacterium limnosediminis]ESU23663.1 hypothetical protein FLJC2902T_32250 [Flavobacterium limnosediminis JC2902]